MDGMLFVWIPTILDPVQLHQLSPRFQDLGRRRRSHPKKRLGGTLERQTAEEPHYRPAVRCSERALGLAPSKDHQSAGVR